MNVTAIDPVRGARLGTINWGAAVAIANADRNGPDESALGSDDDQLC